MRVVFSRFVESDLEEIADWIAQDNPRRAVTFIQEFREAFRKIGEGPLLYQLRRTSARRRGLPSWAGMSFSSGWTMKS